MENITIALSNGTTLTDLEMNGNNYITRQQISEETFQDGLSPVMIGEEEHPEMVLVQVQEHEDGRFWFILRDATPEEIFNAKVRSDIEYLAMMTEVELEA